MDEIRSFHGRSRVKTRKHGPSTWTPWLVGCLLLGLAVSARAQTAPKVSRGQLILPASKGEESSTTPTPNLAQLPAGLPPAPPAVNPVLPVGLPPINPALPLGQMPPEKVPVPKVEVGPAPRMVEPFGPGMVRMPTLDVVGATPPPPSAKDLAEKAKVIGDFIDPRFTLDLVEKRARLLQLKETPRRIQLADESIAIYNLITNKEITILGRSVGTTVMNFWFGEEGKETVISYLVRVFPDPELMKRKERIYKALEIEINKNFPDSVVHLRLIGEKVMVTGQARDAIEAANILRIVHHAEHAGSSGQANGPRIPAESIAPVRRPGESAATPGIEQYENPGTSHVVNLLRIVGEHQVNLRCTVAEVNRSAARSVGLNFQYTGVPGTFVQSIANLTGPVTGANLPMILNTGSGSNLTLTFRALKNMRYARSIAEPNLTTINGQPATFRAGGQFPVPVVTGQTLNGLQGVQFVPFGVQMNFTPFITDKDRIRLLIQGTVSVRNDANQAQIGNTTVPSLTDRQFGTTVEMREGQTFAIGGLIQNNLGADRDQLPFLGDVPFLNRLTGFDGTSASEQELVIMVTPELVHPMEQKMVPPLPGTDIFEPSDVEFYLFGRLESRRHYDFRSPVMNDPQRIRSYQRCEQNYIFGPTGYNAPAPPAVP
jgi:pilus assembly protein CpaC